MYFPVRNYGHFDFIFFFVLSICFYDARETFGNGITDMYLSYVYTTGKNSKCFVFFVCRVRVGASGRIRMKTHCDKSTGALLSFRVQSVKKLSETNKSN